MTWLKNTALVFCYQLSFNMAAGQEEITESIHENMIETSLSRNEEQPIPDISDQTVNFLTEKWSINKITHDQLVNLGLLSASQIHAFLWYRESTGPLISILELQAIPFWTPEIIRQLIPFLKKGLDDDRSPGLKQRWHEGNHTLLFRTGKAEKGSAYNQQLRFPRLFTYRFQFRNLMQWGLTLESDAGEPIKPDHISGFIKVAGTGMLKQFIAGDFTVNIGQGLIHWQGFAAGGTAMLNSFRQGALFRPHTGRDENRFHRGLALTIGRNKWEWSVFGSYTSLDAHIIRDSISFEQNILSFPASGLHRTAHEIAVRKTTAVESVGSRIEFRSQRFKLAMNGLHIAVESPIARRNLPYNRFKQKGRLFTNASWEGTFFTRFGFFYTEWAVDRNLHSAIVAGWVKSITSQLDLSIHYRKLLAPYQAWQSNCFSQSGEANNEQGSFFNMTFSPRPGHRFDAYADSYTFPWVKINADGPSQGISTAIQYHWKPNKRAEWALRWQRKRSWQNAVNSTLQNSELQLQDLSKLRVHLTFIPSEWLQLRIRHEIAFFNYGYQPTELGSLSYIETIIKPALKPVSFSMRYTLFDAESYAARIYAYERDIPSYQYMPAFYGSGYRFYFVGQFKWKKKIHISGKWLTDFRNNQWEDDWRLQISWLFSGDR